MLQMETYVVSRHLHIAQDPLLPAYDESGGQWATQKIYVGTQNFSSNKIYDGGNSYYTEDYITTLIHGPPGKSLHGYI